MFCETENAYNKINKGWLMKFQDQQIGNCFILRHISAATKTNQTTSLGEYEIIYKNI